MCHWCSYHSLTSSVIFYRRDARQHGKVFVLYNNETNCYRWGFFFFNFKIFNITRKPAFVRFGEHEKRPFDVIYCLFKMKQSHWLLCVAKNCDWSRKITPLLNLTRAALLVGWKLTAKAELNCEIYKSYREYWESQVTLCHQIEQLCEPKSSDVALKIAGVELIRSENLRLRSTWRSFDSSFEWRER